MSVSKSKYFFLRGEELIRMLLETSFPIKWLRTGDSSLIRYLSTAEAVGIVASGLDRYEGKARRGRVYYIREIASDHSLLQGDAFRFGMPAVRMCYDIKAASRANYVQDLEALARLREITRRDYFREVRKIPSGRWLSFSQSA